MLLPVQSSPMASKACSVKPMTATVYAPRRSGSCLLFSLCPNLCAFPSQSFTGVLSSNTPNMFPQRTPMASTQKALFPRFAKVVFLRETLISCTHHAGSHTVWFASIYSVFRLHLSRVACAVALSPEKAGCGNVMPLSALTPAERKLSNFASVTNWVQTNCALVLVWLLAE